MYVPFPTIVEESSNEKNELMYFFAVLPRVSRWTVAWLEDPSVTNADPVKKFIHDLPIYGL